MAASTSGTIINGSAASQKLNGTAGDDTIWGGAGNDTMDGGNGSDTYLVGGTGDGFDTFKDTGTSGYDRILATQAGTQIGLASGFGPTSGIEEISANGYADVSIAGSGSHDTLDFSATKLSGIAQIDGGWGNDTITGSQGDDTIKGGVGNDVLNGGNGSDTYLVGGTVDGFDTFKDTGTSGYDRILATQAGTQIGLASGFGPTSGIEEISANGYADVSIAGSGSHDTLDFSATKLSGIAQIDGGWGNDTITGSQGDDTIKGGVGNDVLNGGNGSDTYLVGGTVDGFDTFKDTGTSGYDRILATQAGTQIGLASGFGPTSGIEEISANGYADVSIAGSGSHDTLDFSATKLSGIAQIDGGWGNDTITGSQGDDTIKGGVGNDVLNGGRGNDVLDGGDGTDTAVFAGNFADYSFAKNADGSWQVTGNAGAALADGSDTLIDIESLKFADKTVSVKNLTASATTDITASKPTLSVTSALGSEDKAIALNVAAALTDLDGSESLAITISGVPAGAKLSAGTDQGNGTWTLTPAQLAGLAITPPANSDVDFNLTVTATATESNGGAKTSTSATLPVVVNAVADAPTLVVSPATGLENKAIALNIAAALSDTDGSETLAVTISGVPAGAKLSAGTDQGNGTWTLTQSELPGLTITPPTDFHAEFALTVTATATESGSSASTDSQKAALSGDQPSASVSSSLDVTIMPNDTKASAPVLNVASASGSEDKAIALNVAAALTDLDGSESLAITISGVPAGAKLSAGTDQGNGTWTLTPAQLAGLAITPPANSDVDFNLTVTATATESNGGAKTSTSATLPVIVNAVADAPTLIVSAASGQADTAIALSIASALTDLDGSETLAVTISGVPAGAKLSAGTDQGSGTWTLTPAQLGGLKITPPAGSDADFTLAVKAIATESGNASQATITANLSVTVTPAPTSGDPSGGTVTLTPTIVGTSSSNVLFGTAGSDVIKGGAGNDTMDGGNGSDTYLVGGTGDGFDAYKDTGTSGYDRILATQAGTQIGLAGGFGPQSGIEEISANGFLGVSIVGTGAYDTLDFSATKLSGIALIDAGAGSDTVIGSAGDDTIKGGAGNDMIDGGNGSDTYLVGGTGDGFDAYKDTGTSGYDRILATQAGTQIGLAGGFGPQSGIEEISANGFLGVSIVGTGAYDTLDFSATKLSGIALIDAGAGSDTVIGSAGDDTIKGGAGNDTMDGGNGSDTYLVGGTGDGFDAYKDTGTSGYDRILATQAGTQIGLAGGFGPQSGIEEISANGFLGVSIVGTGAYDTLDFSATKLSGIALIDAGAGSDTVMGSAGDDTIKGGAGNDMLTGGAGNDVLDGGDGTDTAVFAGNFADYSFAKNADGSWQVTGNAGAALADGSDTLIDIESLKFADKNYTLTDSGPVTQGGSSGGSSGGTSSGGTSPSAPLSTAVIYTPDAPVATGGSEIVGFVLENTGSAAQGPAVVSFGQVFVAGDVMPGAKLVAVIGGVEIPVQMDVKAINEDGSVRHAILTLQAPAIAAGGGVEMMLKDSGASAGGSAALTAQDAIAKGLNVSLDINLHNADGSTTHKVINAADLLASAIAQNKVETWMSGSQASEFRVETTVATGLRAVFDIRVQADGNILTDVILANDSTFTAGITSFTYDVAIKQGGQTVYSEAALFHHTNSTWHQQAWLKGEPAINVQRDVDYLIQSGAVPALDTTLGVTEASIQTDYDKLAAADTDPLGSAMLVKAMGMTGGRADLGAVPEWYARYLLTQDARAYEVMLANADAAGAVPWHYTDEATGDAVRMDQHPKLWIDYRGVNQNSLPDWSPTADFAGWGPDTAHTPAISYLPYLFTGSHYYLDEMQAQAAWDIAARNPGYAPGGAMNPNHDQLRALAWTLRDLMDTAYLTPDGDPMKAYFEGLVEKNLAYLVDRYVVQGDKDSAGAVEGWIDSYNSTTGTAIAPWQQDYLAVVLGEAAMRGYEDAATLMQWMENFSAGRFINGENGYNPLMGSAYYLNIRDSAGNLYDSWAELYNANFDPATAYDETLTLNGYAHLSGGYAANARAAMASFVSVTGSADAVEAYGFVISQTQNIALDTFQSNPLWNVTPRLSDGSYLQAEDIFVDTGLGANRVGTAKNELIYGGTGDNTLSGGGGIDLLFGGKGNDVVNGDAGNDYLYGNEGNDTLNGGQGNDILAGGTGADRFVYQAGGGRDEITDFNAQEGDTIHLQGTGISSFAQLQSLLSQDSSGVWITFDQNNNIHLQGTTASELSLAQFILT